MRDGEDQGVDFGVYNKRSWDTDLKILAGIRTALEEYDALIFNQQVQGSLTNEAFIEASNKLFEEYKDKIVVLDSRHYNKMFKGIIRKVNDIEILALRGIEADPKASVPMNEVISHGTEMFAKRQENLYLRHADPGALLPSMRKGPGIYQAYSLPLNSIRSVQGIR